VADDAGHAGAHGAVALCQRHRTRAELHVRGRHELHSSGEHVRDDDPSRDEHSTADLAGAADAGRRHRGRVGRDLVCGQGIQGRIADARQGSGFRYARALGETGVMSIWVGTSGYNYPEWKGSFYPETLPAAKMLPYYAERFATVEINYTFYRA